MSRLYDANSGIPLGEVSQEGLAFLVDHLEEENAEDRDYYIDPSTVDMLAQQGAPEDLLTVLRVALANRPDVEVRYEPPALE